jgi:CheY-like chemotaxis protein
LYSQAKDKFLDFPLMVSPQLSPVLIGDEIRLRQVLINLLGNAIKFTEKGEVKLEIDVINTTDSSQTLRFQTSDTGIGMSEDFTKKIFDKFSQEQSAANRKYQGTGLGMAISFDLIKLMGSELVVESYRDKGTKFYFEITFPIGSDDKLIQPVAATSPGIYKGMKALLVEDNEMNRFIAIQSLNFLGFATTEADNGKRAIEEIKKQAYDLILMDIQMPIVDGVEATQIIRNELNITTPILALTANAFRHDIDLYLSTGMNDFITKPYDEQDFFRKIELVIGKKGPENSPKEDNLQTTNDTINEELPPLYSLSQIDAISRGSDEFVQAMCGLFINLSEESGKEMQEAIENKDWQSIQKTAHKIKPSIDQFDIELIKDTVRQVENYDFTVDSEENFVAQVELIVATMKKVAAELTKI